ncbi:MAG: FAD-dependent oxidoreductase [Calditrichia bacterium]
MTRSFMNSPQKILIIGNGPAGVEAARTLRELNPQVKITIFSKEPYHHYSRIDLSPFLGDGSNPGELQIYPDHWYGENGIQVLLNNPATAIFPEEGRVRDSNGELHPFDRLLIAAGADPFIPPIPGADLPGIQTLRTIADGLQIRKAAKRASGVVILGGGILGIEAAASLRKFELPVTIVELADHLMPVQLDRSGAAVLQHLLEQRGIRVRTGTGAAAFNGESRLQQVELQNGEKISADMALISTGIRSNCALAEKAGLACSGGIVVNEHLQTSHPRIYAAGDAAEFQRTVYGIWPAALEQAQAAARHMLGEHAVYTGSLPLHILKVIGIELTALGRKFASDPAEQVITHRNYEAGTYVKLIHDGRHLLGAISLGVSGLGFRLQRLIRRKQDISAFLPAFEKSDWSVIMKKRASK